jgi:peptide chain release factor
MPWILLSAGRGPEECQAAVRGLVGVLTGEATDAGLEVEALDTETGSHGLLSALLSVNGSGADDFAASWAGTVRWICQSRIRPGVRRKNWFVGVSVLAAPKAGEAFREADLSFETMRASGPGGQHVNKTESAVRLTHLPTGIAVLAREERSQHRNKALALARLATALANKKSRAEAELERDRWHKHDALERGNEIRSYSGNSFERVK